MLSTLSKKNHSGENRAAVIGSPILAKAIMQHPDGGVKIAVVFQKSTTLEFYWVFRAKSARSSRRSWKLAAFYQRDYPFETKPYRDFGSFVAYYAQAYSLAVISERVSHKKRLSSILNKTEHHSILADWTPQDPTTIKTDYVRRRTLAARSRRWVW